MNIAEIYECQEILDIAQNAITEKEKACDKLFKDPKTRELIVEEGERLKNIRDNLKQELKKSPHGFVVNEAMIDAAIDEVLKKNLPVNENNIDALKNVNFDTLTAQYSKESVEDAITTIIARKQDFQQEHLPNLVKSHEIFSGSITYTAEELDQAESCIMDGEC